MGHDLDVRLEDGALWLTLGRPENLNALTPATADRLAEELEGATGRSDVRAVVLTGAGGAFCSGADLGGTDAHESFDVTTLDRANRIIRAIAALPMPCLAAVNGVAAGVGVSLALACDLVVAKKSARFVLAFTAVGLMPDGGATATLAASVGRMRAMRTALLGEPLTAGEAFDAGLVSHVVPDEEFAPTVQRLTTQLCAGPPLAYAATKKAVNQATLPHLEEALNRERTGQTILLRTDDVAEGMRAFGQKRHPRFTGR